MKIIKIYSQYKNFGRDIEEIEIYSAISFPCPEMELLSYDEWVWYILNSKNYLVSWISNGRTIVAFATIEQEQKFIRENKIKSYKRLPNIEHIWSDKYNNNTYFWNNKLSEAKKINIADLYNLKTNKYKLPFWLTAEKRVFTENLRISSGRVSFFIENEYNSYWGTSSFNIILVDETKKIVYSEKEYGSICDAQYISDIKNNFVSEFRN